MKAFFPARFAVLIIVALGLLFQAGCGGPVAVESGPGAPAGQKATVNEKYGFQLVGPAGWRVSTRDGREATATADFFLTNGDKYVEVRVGEGGNGGIVADDANNFRTVRSTKEPFTALGGEGMLFRQVRSTAAGTGVWAEYHFVATRNGYTFDIFTEVPEDQETLPAYFQEILAAWQWRAPDTSLAALGTPGELSSLDMINETQGWALAKGKVLRTEDGGKQWAAVTPPEMASGRWGVVSKFHDQRHAWLAIRNDDQQNVTVYHTTDSGQNWKEATVHTKNNSRIYGAYLDYIDSDHGWLLLEPEHGMSSLPGELYRTSDGGEHWSEVASSGGIGPIEKNGLPFAGPFSFRNAFTGWIGGRQGAAFAPEHPLYLTTDGGRTWRPQELPLPAGRPGGNLDVNALPEFFPAGGQDGLLPVVFVPRSSKTSDYATLFYTTGDGGRTWQERSSLPGMGPASFPTAKNWWTWREETGAAGLAAPVKGKLYRTADGGKNWAILAPGGDLARALEKGEKVRQLDFVTEKTGWLLLATADGRGTELLRTIDGGATWRLVQVDIDPDQRG